MTGQETIQTQNKRRKKEEKNEEREKIDWFSSFDKIDCANDKKKSFQHYSLLALLVLSCCPCLLILFSCLVLFCLVLFILVLSCLVLPCLALPCLALPCLVLHPDCAQISLFTERGRRVCFLFYSPFFFPSPLLFSPCLVLLMSSFVNILSSFVSSFLVSWLSLVYSYLGLRLMMSCRSLVLYPYLCCYFRFLYCLVLLD